MGTTLYTERLAQAMDVLSQTISEIASILRDAQSAANAEATKTENPKGQKQSQQTSSPQATNPSGTSSEASSARVVTVEDVRAVLAEKSQDGLTAKVRELLESFDAKKLSLVDPARLPELLEAAKALK